MDSSTLNLEAIAMVLDRTDRTNSEGELLLRDLLIELVKHVDDQQRRIDKLEAPRGEVSP